MMEVGQESGEDPDRANVEEISAYERQHEQGNGLGFACTRKQERASVCMRF